MSSLERQTENQLSNIEKSTGRTVAEWSEIIRQSGLTKHGQLVAMLKEQYSLGHGNANLLVLKARQDATGGASTGDALIDSHYAGKNAPLRPLYEAVVARIRDFGPDVELAPKKEYVSARRRKLEICLNLPGKEPTERLRATSVMATHRVRIGDTKEIDDELVSWLREAHERA